MRKKIGFDLLALVHRMPATILEQLKIYGKPQSLPQGTHNIHIITPRMDQCQPEKHSAFIWVLKNLCQAGHKAAARAGAWCVHGVVALKPSHPVFFCRFPL